MERWRFPSSPFWDLHNLRWPYKKVKDILGHRQWQTVSKPDFQTQSIIVLLRYFHTSLSGIYYIFLMVLPGQPGCMQTWNWLVFDWSVRGAEPEAVVGGWRRSGAWTALHTRQSVLLAIFHVFFTFWTCGKVSWPAILTDVAWGMHPVILPPLSARDVWLIVDWHYM